MRLLRIAGMAAAALFTAMPAALAQTPTQTTDMTAVQTFAGCLMTERDYRRAHNLGEGTVAGAGLGDEFVLVDVKVTPAQGTTATTPSSSTSAVTSASASASTCADKGVAYRITGPGEEKLKTVVGRQLEIQGRFKDPTDARAGEKLPNEVEMISFREAPSPTPVSEPVAAAPPPPPPTSTVTTPPVTTPPVPVAAPVADPAAERRELPSTASSTALIGLIGVLALSSGVALTVLRRRAL